MNAETAGAVILTLLALPMLGPMLAVALLLYLISVIVEYKEGKRNE